MKKKLLSLSMLSGILLMLPGCNDDKETITTGKLEEKQAALGARRDKKPKDVSGQEILVTINGEPVVYEFDLKQYTTNMIESQPEHAREQYRQIIEVIPGAKRNILDSQINEVLIDLWFKEEGLDKNADYKAKIEENLKRFVETNERMAKIEAFQKSIPSSATNVTAAEARKYYDDNKQNINELIVNQGGVKAQAVMFTEEAAAKKFFDSVKNKPADFEKVAKAENVTVKDLGLVNDASADVVAAVRTQLLAVKKFPVVELVKDEEKDTHNPFIVVKAISKEDAKYLPFEQVQAGIENMLKQQKSTEALMKKLEELKKKNTIKVNEEYFNQQPAQAQNAPSTQPIKTTSAQEA